MISSQKFCLNRFDPRLHVRAISALAVIGDSPTQTRRDVRGQGRETWVHPKKRLLHKHSSLTGLLVSAESVLERTVQLEDT